MCERVYMSVCGSAGGAEGCGGLDTGIHARLSHRTVRRGGSLQLTQRTCMSDGRWCYPNTIAGVRFAKMEGVSRSRAIRSSRLEAKGGWALRIACAHAYLFHCVDSSLTISSSFRLLESTAFTSSSPTDLNRRGGKTVALGASGERQ